ncbi:MAG TPA: hypothetical protein VHY10_19010 [Xanthobacteraceae bacterium]|jgi:hypothetical protein|nr:hypothetical protein [Xanthobacteraceae bacterium]
MAADLLDAIRDQLANFAVGLVERVEGAGSKVRGSGVLVSIEGRRGILTCGHVAEQYDKLSEIGLVRFIAGTQQRRIVNIADAQHIVVQSNDKWTETDLDLAFTYLNPEVADSIAAQSVFLNIEKNRERIEGRKRTNGHGVDVMFGLVDEYSAEPVIEGGKFVSPMRAVIYRGKMHSDQNALLRFQTADDDPEKLPKDFGGLSGSGLWRIHFVDHGAGRFEIIEKQLWGITSWQINKQSNRGATAGQGWDRIDQGLIPCVREKLQF